MRTATFFLLAAPAVAFMPAPMPANSRTAVRMSAEEGNKMSLPQAVGKFLATAALANAAFLPIAPEMAQAKAGDSPKVSVFGIGGDAYSSPFVEDTKTYSPYSPYGATGGLYKPLSEEATAIYKRQVTEGANRIKKIGAYIDGKKHEEVRTELTRQLYELRKSALGLAKAKGSKEAEKAAKTLFQDLEQVNVYNKLKDTAASKAEYEKSLKSLDAFLNLVK